ncbi:hypothetical protein SUGI_0116180 [Cryptomeria japonica]|nr:hypothetical protein SUGI_0116180 [Cryptomeria japonica]
MTGARGALGYISPELWYRNLGPVMGKSDVYSFGMVLLELVGGRKNFDMQRGLRGIDKAKLECEEEEKAIRLDKVGLW